MQRKPVRKSSAIHRLQGQLNRQYDAFRAKHGLINSRSAELSFRDDSSYYLLCSLENVDEKGNFISKSDMFTKRTIRSAQIPDHADTASDALALSIGERAKVDMPYMMHLTGKDEATLAKELAGVIFVEPFRKQEDGSPVYLMADEYLSGNVREKLRIAHVAADQDPAFRINVEALEQVQPKDLTAGEITVRLGVTWIGSEIIKQFADELFQSTYREQKIAVRYNEYLNNWYISNKSQGNDNIRVTNTYGTKRINGYHLLENALNLRATKIYDTVYDENGKEQHKLNGPATEEAQAKQRMIEDAFKDWIFKDRERRESLVALYNEKFNCIRPREYDGSHIQFFGMNPEIALRPHQRNAIAHILYGHNTLLAHVVGAGKTYEMVAAAMEKKRLGLCSKTLVAVPNHLTGQFASEALKLYPNANILVTTQRDFEKTNRKRFCAKIATGNYDIVVIGHSQFEKIPLSDARKAEFIRKQIDELEMQLESMDNSDSRLTVKQLESKKKQLKTKLSNLLDAPKRDDVVTFEELGADSLMVDEAHNFKNLMTVTKMHNIAGISTTESQKASDLFMKCQYLDEITGARGVTFIKEKMDLDVQLTRLKTLKAAHDSQRYELENKIAIGFPAEIRKCKEQIENATVDAATVKEHSVVDADGKDVFCIQLEKKVYYEKEPAGKALLGLLGLALNNEKPVPIGYFKGMELQIQHLPFGNEYHARLVGSGTYSTQLGADVLGNLTRLSNLVNGIEPSIEKTRNMQIQLEQQLASAEEEVKRPFPQATELTEKSKRLAVLEGLLNMNDKDIVTDTEPEQQCQTDNRQRGQEER